MTSLPAADPFGALSKKYSVSKLLWACSKRECPKQNPPIQLNQDTNGIIRVKEISPRFQDNTGIQAGHQLLQLQGKNVADYQGGLEEIQRTIEETLVIEMVVLKSDDDSSPAAPKPPFGRKHLERNGSSRRSLDIMNYIDHIIDKGVPTPQLSVSREITKPYTRLSERSIARTASMDDSMSSLESYGNDTVERESPALGKEKDDRPKIIAIWGWDSGLDSDDMWDEIFLSKRRQLAQSSCEADIDKSDTIDPQKSSPSLPDKDNKKIREDPLVKPQNQYRKKDLLWVTNTRCSTSQPVPFQLIQDDDDDNDVVVIRIHQVDPTFQEATGVREGQQLAILQEKDIESYNDLDEIQAVLQESLEINLAVVSKKLKKKKKKKKRSDKTKVSSTDNPSPPCEPEETRTSIITDALSIDPPEEEISVITDASSIDMDMLLTSEHS